MVRLCVCVWHLGRCCRLFRVQKGGFFKGKGLGQVGCLAPAKTEHPLCGGSHSSIRCARRTGHALEVRGRGGGGPGFSAHMSGFGMCGQLSVRVHDGAHCPSVFFFARAVPSPRTQSVIEVVGSPPYIAPEKWLMVRVAPGRRARRRWRCCWLSRPLHCCSCFPCARCRPCGVERISILLPPPVRPGPHRRLTTKRWTCTPSGSSCSKF